MKVVHNADVIFVAVKPQYVAAVLAEARPHLTDRHVLVSIAAGITVAQLAEAAGPEARVVRVMPNTPCLVGETAAAMCVGGKARAAQGWGGVGGWVEVCAYAALARLRALLMAPTQHKHTHTHTRTHLTPPRPPPRTLTSCPRCSPPSAASSSW